MADHEVNVSTGIGWIRHDRNQELPEGTDADPGIFSHPGVEKNRHILPEDFGSNPVLTIIPAIMRAIENRIRINRTLNFFPET